MILIPTLIVFVALIALIIGLINPSLIKFKKGSAPLFATRKQVALICGGTLIVASVLSIVLSGTTEPSAQTSLQQEQVETKPPAPVPTKIPTPATPPPPKQEP